MELNKEPSKIEQLVLLVVKQLNNKPFPIHFKTRKVEVIRKMEREGLIKIMRVKVEGEDRFYIVKGENL